MAVEKRHVETVEAILTHRDIKINAGGFLNFTPLHYAVLKVRTKSQSSMDGRTAGTSEDCGFDSRPRKSDSFFSENMWLWVSCNKSIIWACVY